MSSAPKFTPSILNCTPTTPMLSEAVALSVTAEPETVEPFDGEVIETVGKEISIGIVTLIVVD